MASPFNAGTSDLKSTSLPAALLEASFLLQATELATPIATRPNRVNITLDTEAGLATISAVLGITNPVLNAVNDLAFNFDAYAGVVGFVPVFDPTGSDITAVTKDAAVAQLAASLNSLERALVTPIDNINLSVDFDALTMTIGASIPFTVALDVTGQAVITGVDYIP